MSAEPSREPTTVESPGVADPQRSQKMRNRPGLRAISYRLGTYATFRQAMMEKGSSVEVEVDGKPSLPLQGWSTGASGDYGRALLEMWAYLADILTFYQERIANEAFLGTARHEESVLRLVALLGYEPDPGRAARVNLALTVESDEPVQIPEKMRVLSTPGQDGKTQTFETVEEGSASSRLNRVRIHPEPVESTPENKPLLGRTEALLHPSEAETIVEAVAPGDPFVMFNIAFDEATPLVPEEKEVGAFRVSDRGTLLSWNPAVRQDLPWTSLAFAFVRKMRIFGYNAPKEYLKPSNEGNAVVWSLDNRNPDNTRNDYIFYPSPPDSGLSLTLDPSPSDGDLSLTLDSLYDDLRLGTKLLLHVAGKTPAESPLALLEVSSVGQELAELYPLSDTVTRIGVTVIEVNGRGDTLPPFDRREAVVHELTEPKIVFWSYRYGGALSGSDVIVAKAEDLAEGALEPGRTVMLADEKGGAEQATVKAVETTTYGGVSHTKISLESLVESELDAETAVLLGNVVRATHGETISEEVLGDGDSSVSFQSFVLKSAPVTFLDEPGAPGGRVSTLRVTVGGDPWEEVDEFYGRGGGERVYTTTRDAEGQTTVRFGDGSTGSRLPTGARNVVASYRQGLGRGGNVKKDSLVTPLDSPLGLTSVTNPKDAWGGTDQDTKAKARETAPRALRTVERAVSLRDLEEAALQYDGVAKARAMRLEDTGEPAVKLVVAGEEGAEVSQEVRADLVGYLNRIRGLGGRLDAHSYDKVPVEVGVDIRVLPDHRDEDVVVAATRGALEDFFAFDNLELGEAIYLSDIYERLSKVPGVVALSINRLRFEDREENGGRGAAIPEEGYLRLEPGQLATLGESTVEVGMGAA
jgi:uncharacterized phage protein gp47/JayE